MVKPTLGEFVKSWWKKFHEENPKAKDNWLYQNGQLDELPYIEYEEKYGCEILE